MWKCVCVETETRIWWRENTYSVMWKCVCVETETRIWWRENTYLIMLGYGHDESAPTPGGVFATNFVECSLRISRNVCWYFAECFVCISLVYVGFSRCVRCIFADRQQHFRKPFAAVGADLSCPRIWMYPRNGERKCVFGEMDMCIWWCKNT